MGRTAFRIITLLGAVAIVGILFVQIYWVRQLFAIQEQQFSQQIEGALTNVAEQMFSYNESTYPNESPVNQVQGNYYVVNINDVIDANVLEHYLTTEFEKRQLELDFEYAIYDCSSDKMVYGAYVNSGDWKIDPEKRRELPKWNEFTYYFGILFPNKSNFLLNKMWLWIFFTVVMLLFILFYAYALFVIFKQKQLSEFRKDFIDNMTHEFKTPISTINISADVLAQPGIRQDPKRMSHYVEIIKDEIGRLNRQVEKVLQMSKVEKSNFDLRKEKIDLFQLLREVNKNLSGRLKAEGVEVQNNFIDDEFIVSADRLHLTNAIYNLIDNAIKYSNEPKELKIGCKKENGKIVLNIADNGIGIDPSLKKRIFDKFFRVPTKNKHDVKGFGIGLHYVKSVCDAHLWKLSLESELGSGSNFIIEIPTNG